MHFSSLKSLAVSLPEAGLAVVNHVSGSQAGVARAYQRPNWKQEKGKALDDWNRHLVRTVGDAVLYCDAPQVEPPPFSRAS